MASALSAPAASVVAAARSKARARFSTPACRCSEEEGRMGGPGAASGDGVAAPVLVSREKAKNLGLQVLARPRGYADAAKIPYNFRHVSYLQKEGTRPSSRPVAVSSFDSFVQQGGDLPFFTSRATRVIDAEYRCPVGVVLFNHSEVDFAVKPGDCVAQMIVQVIATPEVTEVEDLDTTVWGREDSGPPRFELRALVDTSREVLRCSMLHP
uniref:dUTP diphosphatase n=1 Tax=Aegilops tauschii TaxID=37682 RepID=N1QX42_AEGTA